MREQLYLPEEVTIDRNGIAGSVGVFDGDGDLIFSTNSEEMSDAAIRTAINLMNRAFSIGHRCGRSELQRSLRNLLDVPSKQEVEGVPF